MRRKLHVHARVHAADALLGPTISAEPPSEQREQEREVAGASVASRSDHKEGTPASTEVPVTGSRTSPDPRA